jgi:hypothetical protein
MVLGVTVFNSDRTDDEQRSSKQLASWTMSVNRVTGCEASKQSKAAPDLRIPSINTATSADLLLRRDTIIPTLTPADWRILAIRSERSSSFP